MLAATQLRETRSDAAPRKRLEEMVRPDTDDIASAGAFPETGQIVLAVGGIDNEASEFLRKDGATLVSCSFASLDQALLDHLRPSGLAFALFATGFDAAQLIAVLDELGYSGWVCVISPRLPDRRMVERELRAFGSKIDLRFWESPVA